MNYKITIVICMLFGFAFTPNFYSQDTSSQSAKNERYVRILLNEANTYKEFTIDGRVIEITEDYFLLDIGLMGNIKIDKRDILNIENIQPESVGDLELNDRSTDVNPQSSRYFFSPSAHQLKKGDGYYHNVAVLYNSVSFGILDNVTAGLTFTPFGAGGTLKVGGQINENLSMSAGGLVVMPFFTSGNGGVSDNITGPIAIPFANVTVGSERRNFSFNYGLALIKGTREFRESVRIYDDLYNYWDSYNYIGSIDGSLNSHMFNISSMLEINPTAWLLVEAYLIRMVNRDTTSVTMTPQYPWTTVNLPQSFEFNADPVDSSVLMIGLRKANSKRTVLWDFGLIHISAQDRWVPLPWAAITIPL